MTEKEEKIAEWNRLQKEQLEESPVGIRPRKQWLEERLQEINSAMTRYAAVNKIIPVEWLTEYLKLATEVQELEKIENSTMSINDLRRKHGFPPLSSPLDLGVSNTVKKETASD